MDRHNFTLQRKDSAIYKTLKYAIGKTEFYMLALLLGCHISRRYCLILLAASGAVAEWIKAVAF